MQIQNFLDRVRIVINWHSARDIIPVINNIAY